MLTCIGCGVDFEPKLTNCLGKVYKRRKVKYCNKSCQKSHYILTKKSTISHRKVLYGLSQLQYESLYTFQKGLCLLCNEPLTGRISVDHDHSCCPEVKTCGKCIRGLLHAKCNIGLGAFDDNPEKLRKAANYLEITKTVQPFKVNLEEAEKFSKVWTYKGIHIVLPSEAHQFAADFANLVLRDFIAMCQNQAQTKPSPHPVEKKIIVEGI